MWEVTADGARFKILCLTWASNWIKFDTWPGTETNSSSFWRAKDTRQKQRKSCSLNKTEKSLTKMFHAVWCFVPARRNWCEVNQEELQTASCFKPSECRRLQKSFQNNTSGLCIFKSRGVEKTKRQVGPWESREGALEKKNWSDYSSCDTFGCLSNNQEGTKYSGEA